MKPIIIFTNKKFKLIKRFNKSSKNEFDRFEYALFSKSEDFVGNMYWKEDFITSNPHYQLQAVLDALEVNLK